MEAFYSIDYDKKYPCSSYMYIRDREYYLMHKNVKVLKMKMSKSGFGVIATEIYEPRHFPVLLQGSANMELNIYLGDWLRSRRMSLDRPNAEKIQTITGYTIEELYVINMGLSLYDCYWFCPVEKINDTHWEEINFFRKGFSEDIGNILFGNECDKDSINIRSPEFTTNTTVFGKWLSEYGTPSFLLSTDKPYDIYLSSRIAASLKLKIPKIDLLNEIPNTITIFSFTNDNQDFIPFSTFLRNPNIKYNTLSGLFDHFKENKIMEYISLIVVLDYVTGNRTRRFDNIGIVRNANTLTFESFSKLFSFSDSITDKTNYSLFIGDTHKEQLSFIGELSESIIRKLECIQETFPSSCISCGIPLNLKKEYEHYINDRITKLIGEKPAQKPTPSPSSNKDNNGRKENLPDNKKFTPLPDPPSTAKQESETNNTRKAEINENDYTTQPHIVIPKI